MITNDIISTYSIIQRSGRKYIDFPVKCDTKNNILEIYDDLSQEKSNSPRNGDYSS